VTASGESLFMRLSGGKRSGGLSSGHQEHKRAFFPLKN